MNWFLSRTVRHAGHMRKHVHRLLSAQRDVLTPKAIDGLETALRDFDTAIARSPDKPTLLGHMQKFEDAANHWLKPYPNAGLRENVEVLLVAIAVAMAIRTFFLQPFKIPTGSMQPTLYGITTTPDLRRHGDADADFTVPNWFSRLANYWFRGVGYVHVVAKADGPITAMDETPKRLLLFNLWQRFKIGDVTHTVWFPPDNVWRISGLIDSYLSPARRTFKRGEDVIKMKVISGDHLFVDRLTYNFRRPARGEIIVFETKGVHHPQVPQDQFYIKRLVGLGTETIRVLDDRHLAINGRRLDAGTPRFDKVYSFDPQQPPADSIYSGHVNESVARTNGYANLAPFFPDGAKQFQIQPKHYLVMGDNTMSSLDSRSWGDFPQESVIGRSCFVYWPFGRQDGRPARFGIRTH